MNFRGTVFEWWTTELFDTEKIITKFGDGVDEWFTWLIFKFKKPFPMAIDIIFYKKYTMKNVINRREPREFTEKIIRSARNTGFTQTRIQFDIIYNAVEFELRRDFRRPDNVSVFNSYFTNMDKCKHVGWIHINKYQHFNVISQTFRFRNQYENKLQRNVFNRKSNQSNYRPGYVTGNANQINFRPYQIQIYQFPQQYQFFGYRPNAGQEYQSQP